MKTPASNLAAAFKVAENNMRLEGINPSENPEYEKLKARVISGETSFADAKKEILRRHQATNK